jgi:hypothetical protein
MYDDLSKLISLFESDQTLSYAMSQRQQASFHFLVLTQAWYCPMTRRSHNEHK